jgi:peroxiredoxin
MKKYLFLIIPFLILASCTKRDHFILKGSIGPSARKTIYISLVKVDETLVADSAKINKRGLFRFRIKAAGTDFYQVGTSPDNFITLLAGPGEKIYLRFPDENLAENYTVEGSEGSEQVRLLDIRLLKTKKSLDSITGLYRKAETEADFETRGKALEDEYVRLLKDQRRFNIEFILKHMKSLSSIKALYQKVDDDTYVLYESRDLQYLKIVADSLQKYYPRSNHTKALVADLSREMNQFYARQLEQLSSSLPETKLDPDLTDLTGKRIRLSSLRGKYVLLTFWSVESRECIAENLQLKEFYKTYNRKGFEIYQVNLDQDEEAWRNAVRFDELPWISTREDDPSNPQIARLYNVRSLPANYLYDPEGAIVARDIHGRTLQLKLSQLFNTR